MTILELNKYYDDLNALADENASDIRFQNEDRAHNAVVMRIIFERATTIKMYCGEFSIFRTDFKKKVDSSLVYEEGEENDSPMLKLYDSLENFLRRDGTLLEVIIEKPGHVFWEDIYSYDKLYPFITSEKIKFHMFKDGFTNFSDAYHFTVGDQRMYRRESDKESHSAIGGFNNPDGSKILLTRFQQLKENAIPLIRKISLPSLACGRPS